MSPEDDPEYSNAGRQVTRTTIYILLGSSAIVILCLIVGLLFC